MLSLFVCAGGVTHTHLTPHMNLFLYQKPLYPEKVFALRASYAVLRALCRLLALAATLAVHLVN